MAAHRNDYLQMTSSEDDDKSKKVHKKSAKTVKNKSLHVKPFDTKVSEVLHKQ